MPRKSKGKYPENWKEIAARVKDDAKWKCIRCGAPHDPKNGRCLTVHHADLNPSNNAWYNLLALDQVCHLQIQAKVHIDQPYMYEHATWFKPFIAGFYAKKYLGLDLSREEVEARLDELLALERIA